jgi:hypothetical protein
VGALGATGVKSLADRTSISSARRSSASDASARLARVRRM